MGVTNIDKDEDGAVQLFEDAAAQGHANAKEFLRKKDIKTFVSLQAVDSV